MTLPVEDAAVGSAPRQATQHAVRGALGRVPSHAAIELLRWLTGWAALAWLLRALATVTGFARGGEIWLEPGALRARRCVTFWGKIVRESVETYPLASVAGVRRSARYPLLRLGLAAFGFGVAAFVGSFLLLDGLRTGTGSLIAIAGCVLALGAGFDLVLRLWLPGARGRAGIEIDLLPRSGIRLRDVDTGAADALVAELSRRLARG